MISIVLFFLSRSTQIPFPPNSVVTTREQTLHKTDQKSDIEFKVVNPDEIFTLIKEYADAKSGYSVVDFWKDRDNHVTLSRTWRNSKLEAVFTGANVVQQLPTNFNSYRVTLMGNALIQKADIDAVLSWQSASDIQFYDDSDNDEFTSALLRRVDEFKTKQLKTLALSLGYLSISMDVMQLFNHIGSLHTLELNASNDIYFKFSKFVENVAANKSFKAEKTDLLTARIQRITKLDNFIDGVKNIFKW